MIPLFRLVKLVGWKEASALATEHLARLDTRRCKPRTTIYSLYALRSLGMFICSTFVYNSSERKELRIRRIAERMASHK